MTRLGWGILALVVVMVAAFLSVTTFGGASHRPAVVVAGADPQPVAGALAVPVAGVARATITDSWGDARGDGTRAHHGTDIIAPAGTPVVAAAAGRVEKLFQSRLGGVTLYVRSVDRRWTYYYAHLAGYAAGVREGMTVRAGDPLGFVGDTGDAGPGNYHLHFGVARMRADERWWQGEDVDPYPMLAGRGPPG
jgi:murein DD-endopeptidase MepM/ murein hydrolase activator NlpD